MHGRPTFGDFQESEKTFTDEDAEDTAHDAQDGHEVRVAVQIRGRGRREGEGQAAGCEGETSRCGDAEEGAEAGVQG